MRWSVLVALLPFIAGMPVAAAAQGARGGETAPFRVTEQRPQCLNYQALRQPFFGELHLHTEYSADAATLDTRNTPRDAYRFARGEVVGLPPFVDTRTATEKQQDAAAAQGTAPPVSAHPYCLPPEHCQFTATRQVQLPQGRELDFAAVTDHAEFFGETNICFYESTEQCSKDSDCHTPGQTCSGPPGGGASQCVPQGYGNPACILAREEVTRLRSGPGTALFATYVTNEFPQRFPFCKERGAGGKDTCTLEASNVWQAIQRAADEAYDRTPRCSFTTFKAYEYTGQPATGECVADANPCFADADCSGSHGGLCCMAPSSGPGCEKLTYGGASNLHRNVIFRNDDVIDLPITYMEAPTGCGKGSDCASHQGGALASPQTLLQDLQKECLNNPSHPRCDVISIPHNANISGGAMFLMPESVGEASVRAQMEPLVELFQIKGSSECRYSAQGLWGTTDEMCNFEALNYAKLAGSVIPDPDALSILPGTYVRNALKEGLQYLQSNNVNPFQLGFVGATDNHNGTPSATEPEMYAEAGGHGDASFVVPGQALNDAFYLGFETNGGGITGVWAEENTRDAIFAALQRRETFATSGTRPTIRMFAGALPEDICRSGNFAAAGYKSGVPQGGTLKPADGGPPRFAVAATMDPGWPGHPGTELQSLQIIKGWVDKSGNTHETTVNIAGNPRSDASVDLASCARIGAGARDFCATWSDPDFDRAAPAFYYARVLENPSCRWNQYYCRAAHVDCSAAPGSDGGASPWLRQQCCSAAVPKTVQQRAWSSPIWYVP